MKNLKTFDQFINEAYDISDYSQKDLEQIEQDVFFAAEIKKELLKKKWEDGGSGAIKFYNDYSDFESEEEGIYIDVNDFNGYLENPQYYIDRAEDGDFPDDMDVKNEFRVTIFTRDMWACSIEFKTKAELFKILKKAEKVITSKIWKTREEFELAIKKAGLGKFTGH